MCWVLQDMKKADDLDTVVRKAPLHMYADAEWWDTKGAHVNLIWLTNKWVDYQCPNHGEVDDEAVPEVELEDERTDTEREADEQAALAREGVSE